jgi:hypothetical protein
VWHKRGKIELLDLGNTCHFISDGEFVMAIGLRVLNRYPFPKSLALTEVEFFEKRKDKTPLLSAYSRGIRSDDKSVREVQLSPNSFQTIGVKGEAKAPPQGPDVLVRCKAARLTFMAWPKKRIHHWTDLCFLKQDMSSLPKSKAHEKSPSP